MRLWGPGMGTSPKSFSFALLSTTDGLVFPELQLIGSKSMCDCSILAIHMLAGRSVCELLARALPPHHLSQCSPSQPSLRDISTQAQPALMIPTCASVALFPTHSQVHVTRVREKGGSRKICHVSEDPRFMQLLLGGLNGWQTAPRFYPLRRELPISAKYILTRYPIDSLILSLQRQWYLIGLSSMSRFVSIYFL